MSSIEDRYNATAQRITDNDTERRAQEARQAQQRRREAVSEALFTRFQQSGIALRDAFFLSDDARQDIAGLVATYSKAQVAPERISRATKMIPFFDIARQVDFVTGWQVRFPRTETSHYGGDDYGHEVVATQVVIATPDYQVYSGRSKEMNELGCRRIYPAEFNVANDALEQLVRAGLQIVDPAEGTY